MKNRKRSFMRFLHRLILTLTNSRNCDVREILIGISIPSQKLIFIPDKIENEKFLLCHEYGVMTISIYAALKFLKLNLHPSHRSAGFCPDATHSRDCRGEYRAV